MQGIAVPHNHRDARRQAAAAYSRAARCQDTAARRQDTAACRTACCQAAAALLTPQLFAGVAELMVV